MNSPIKTKKLFTVLFPFYLFISIVGLGILLIITRFAFRNFYYNEISTSLIQKAKIIEPEIARIIIKRNLEELKIKTDIFSKKAENRISIILPTGVVIADSSFDVLKMENHKDRVEIKEAINGRTGQSTRFSPTLKENHLYIAIPLYVEGKIIGVLRNSVSVEKMKSSLSLLTGRVLFWSLLLLLLLTYFIYHHSRKISRPLEQMKLQIDSFSDFNFNQENEIKSSEINEIATLFSAFYQMKDKLRKQIELIANQKNEQLAVFASMIESVITIKSDLTINHINSSALTLFDYNKNKEGIKGTPLGDLIQSDILFELVSELFQTKKTISYEFEYRPGVILHLHGTILQAKDLGAVLVFEDVSKVRELENHRKQFVANVSHELKTPLTAIQGYLETLREDEIDDPKLVSRFLDIMNKHSLRLSSIIEDLLMLSSFEKEKEIGNLKFSNQNLKPLLENTVLLCREKSIKKSMDIKIESTDISIPINSALIEQAMINLLDNAIKYSPDGSKITLKLEKSDLGARILIMDTGPGIADIHHERLFERFYSVDKARSRELGGSGLGLSIVKHIAISHGGNIKVESQLGLGTTFIFDLPKT